MCLHPRDTKPEKVHFLAVISVSVPLSSTSPSSFMEQKIQKKNERDMRAKSAANISKQIMY